jgi:hypothetical protein
MYDRLSALVHVHMLNPYKLRATVSQPTPYFDLGGTSPHVRRPAVHSRRMRSTSSRIAQQRCDLSRPEHFLYGLHPEFNRSVWLPGHRAVCYPSAVGDDGHDDV